MVETRPTLLEEHRRVLGLVQGNPELKWFFGKPDHCRTTWLFRLRQGMWTNPPLFGMRTFFAMSLRGWISDAFNISSSSMSGTMMSPFQIHPAFNANPMKIPSKNSLSKLVESWQVSGRDRRFSDIDAKGIAGPLNGSPKRRSWGVVPSDKRSSTFRRYKAVPNPFWINSPCQKNQNSNQVNNWTTVRFWTFEEKWRSSSSERDFFFRYMLG